MRFGYAAWGFLSDIKIERGKHVSTPDGNATYSSNILFEAQIRNWETYWMHEDRDEEAISIYECNSFASFSQELRWSAYKDTINTYGVEFPELDILLLEWRFPIPGRNCDIDISDINYQPDLDRQNELLEFYKQTDTKIIIWDLDHKLTIEDELKWKPDAIFETSINPLMLSMQRVSIEPPIFTNHILQLDTLKQDINRKLVYVGSRYERDDVIEQYIKPVSTYWPQQVEFYGNWTTEKNLKVCKELWPDISYNGRITTSQFRETFGTAMTSPLLGKRSYLQQGFITPRPFETLMFGTIPIGLKEHIGIDKYTILQPVESAKHLIETIKFLEDLTLQERDKLRKDNIDKLDFMHVKYFFDKIELI